MIIICLALSIIILCILYFNNPTGEDAIMFGKIGGFCFIIYFISKVLVEHLISFIKRKKEKQK